MRPLRNTLVIIGIVQFFFGLPFIFAPKLFSGLLGLPDAPAWANWLLIMNGARFLGMGYGMLLSARDPIKHVGWINAMIVVQALDWLGTVYAITTGGITLLQATSAPYLPIIFIVALIAWHPRNSAIPNEIQT